jgi:hypothetical protein
MLDENWEKRVSPLKPEKLQNGVLSFKKTPYLEGLVRKGVYGLEISVSGLHFVRLKMCTID